MDCKPRNTELVVRVIYVDFSILFKLNQALYIARKTKLFAWTMNSVTHIRDIPVKMCVNFNIVFYWH